MNMPFFFSSSSHRHQKSFNARKASHVSRKATANRKTLLCISPFIERAEHSIFGKTFVFAQTSTVARTSTFRSTSIFAAVSSLTAVLIFAATLIIAANSDLAASERSDSPASSSVDSPASSTASDAQSPSASDAALSETDCGNQTWTPLYQGIDFIRLESDEPLQKLCVLRIDLKAPGISFYTTGRHPDFQDSERETDRRTTVDFLVENDLSVAVNGNFYLPFNDFTRKNRGPADVTGLAVCDGVCVSKSKEHFPSFLIDKSGRPEIRQVGEDEPIDEIQTAVSGPFIVLKEGEIVQNDDAVHPRTAVGISQDRRYVFLMTIDGRQPNHSVGATPAEIAQWFLKIGAYDGLNLDGGGSTTMVQQNADGTPRVLNRPVGLGAPGSLRHNANGLGVRALPL